MAVIVLGATGWIGRAVMRRLPQARPVGRADELRATKNDVVINAAGSRTGTDEQLTPANVTLVQQALESAGWVIQLGSAAEYGLDAQSPVTEATRCQPGAAYGRTKLRGTQLCVASGNATVLRLFNLIDSPPQAGSPIADIWARIQRGVQTRTPVEVLSGGTVRDYVSRGFVAEAIAWAVDHRPAAIYNLGSGVPASVYDIAVAAVARLGADLPVADLQAVPASRIWCDPCAWELATGMRQRLGPEEIAAYLTEQQP